VYTLLASSFPPPQWWCKYADHTSLWANASLQYSKKNLVTALHPSIYTAACYIRGRVGHGSSKPSGAVMYPAHHPASLISITYFLSLSCQNYMPSAVCKMPNINYRTFHANEKKWKRKKSNRTVCLQFNAYVASFGNWTQDSAEQFIRHLVPKVWCFKEGFHFQCPGFRGIIQQLVLTFLYIKLSLCVS